MTPIQAWLFPLALFVQGEEAAGVRPEIPLRLSLAPPEFPKEQPLPPAPAPTAQAGRPFIDLEWLEVSPRLGLAVFAEDYEADPAFLGSVLARAPMPWLSPASDPKGEYFGLFAAVALGTIERDIDPEPEDSDGILLLLTAGVDYTLYRDETWLILAQAGIQYAHFGGVTDLDDGVAPLVGATVGISVAGGVSLTYTPEVAFGNSGDLIFFNLVGAMIKF